MGFTIIETQEQFDNAIAERLKRERESIKKEYSGYMSPEDLAEHDKSLNGQIATLQTSLQTKETETNNLSNQLEEMGKKIKEYETDAVKFQVAEELGLSWEAKQFIQGTDEESIRKSAESRKNISGKGQEFPLANPEPSNSNQSNITEAEMEKLLKRIRSEE